MRNISNVHSGHNAFATAHITYVTWWQYRDEE